MKQMIYGIEITTLAAVASQPVVAQAVGLDPLNAYSQLGIIGMLCVLLWWQTAKTVPEIQRLHTIEVNRVLKVNTEMSSNIQAMTSEIRGMRGDATEHQKEWCKKLDERPCLGLEGMLKLRNEIEGNCNDG